MPVRLLGEDLVLFRNERWRLGADQPLLRPPRRRPLLRPARERRPALPLPRLALRRRRPVPRAAGRTGAQPLRREDSHHELSLRGAQRHRLRLPRRRRPAAVPRLRLLRRAGRLHLRVQGPVGVQLAAGRRGRDRPEPRLVPAPLPRRRPARGVRPAVPRGGRRAPATRSPSSSATTSGPTSRSRTPTTACGSTRCATSTTASGTCGSRTCSSRTPSSSRSATRRSSRQWHVPIDDKSHYWYMILYDFAEPTDKETLLRPTARARARCPTTGRYATATTTGASTRRSSRR